MTKKFKDETADNMAKFFTRLPEDHVSTFCHALTQIHPKNSKRILKAARSAMSPKMSEKGQCIAMKKIGLLSASILCPAGQKLPYWLSLTAPMPKPVEASKAAQPIFDPGKIDTLSDEELNTYVKEVLCYTFKDLLCMFSILEQKKTAKF